jgi:hypothetical protein
VRSGDSCKVQFCCRGSAQYGNSRMALFNRGHDFNGESSSSVACLARCPPDAMITAQRPTAYASVAANTVSIADDISCAW